MKDFRNDLLELLLEHSGEYVDIMPLIEKHFGDIYTFEQENDYAPKSRGKINDLLRELTEMKWINTIPPGGLSRSHHMNQQTMKREFIFDYSVKAKMTTKGEIEYKKAKKEEEPANPSIHVGGNFAGVLNTGEIKDSQVSVSLSNKEDKPEASNQIPPKKRSSTLSMWVKIIIGISAIVSAILKAFKVI